MTTQAPPALARLVEGLLGPRRRRRLFRRLHLPMELVRWGEPQVSQAELALALALVLFDDVTERVPLAEAYAADAEAAGRRLVFDHGALRTVAALCGDLPAGRAAIARVLEPLGYEPSGVYPLERIGMTGHVYTHAQFPERLPQYFVSELHPERFSLRFQQAVERTVGSSADPLSLEARDLLARLAAEGGLPYAEAARLLPWLRACFERQHEAPSLEDYERLLAESPEMAWIATEGNAFNHATDRVDNVALVAEAQRDLGRPVKEALEVSESGRVLQTAFRAGLVERLFRGPDGQLIPRRVPGSFHEFITRRPLPDGRLDLAFDTNNAQGIFKMTDAKHAS